MITIALILIALKIAGVGNFSWLIPIGLFILDVIIRIIVESSKSNKIGSDWHDRMLD